MNTSEKKWYLHNGVQQEGPFSTDEVKARISGGTLKIQDYIWADGFDDWKPIFEVESLKMETGKPPSMGTGSGSMQSPTKPSNRAVHKDEISLVSAIRNQEEHEKTSALDLGSLKKANREAKDADKIARKAKSKHEQSTAKVLFGVSIIVFVAALGFAAFKLKDTEMGKAAMVKWLAYFPPIDDVSPGEYAELKSAAGTPFKSQGPKIAMGLSTSDVNSPSFYVSANLPDGVTFDVIVSGVPGTLLSEMTPIRQQGILSNRLLKIGPFKLGPGDYFVYVLDAANQPDSVHDLIKGLPNLPVEPGGDGIPHKFNVTKKYFLGGVKDGNYQAKLDLLKQEAKQKQIQRMLDFAKDETTLEALLTSYVESVEKSAKLKQNAAAKKKSWEALDKDWQDRSKEFAAKAPDWTSLAAVKEQQISNIATQFQTSWQSMQQLHDVAQGFFDGKVEYAAFESQFQALSAKIQQGLASLKGIIDVETKAISEAK